MTSPSETTLGCGVGTRVRRGDEVKDEPGDVEDHEKDVHLIAVSGEHVPEAVIVRAARDRELSHLRQRLRLRERESKKRERVSE